MYRSFMCWNTCLLAENTTNSPFFHNVPCLPPPPPQKKKLLNNCLRFLLGRLYYAGEIGNNGYAKFWRVNRVRYGLCEMVNFSAPQPRP